MTPYELALTWVLFMAFSVCGWACETVVCSVSARHLINRGFLNGPYCPIYGCGSLAAIALLRDVHNPLCVFLLGGLVTCSIEYATSWAMERLYHASWWDYSKRPLNIHGRVWIGGFVEFGSGIMVVLYLAYPGLCYLLGLMPPGQLELLALALATVFWSDFAVTQTHMTGFRRKMDYLRGEVSLHVQTARDALPSRADLEGAAGWARLMGSSVTAQVRGMGQAAATSLSLLPARLTAALAGIPERFVAKLNAQERRVMSAYPALRPAKYQRLVDELYGETGRALVPETHAALHRDEHDGRDHEGEARPVRPREGSGEPERGEHGGAHRLRGTKHVPEQGAHDGDAVEVEPIRPEGPHQHGDGQHGDV